MFTLGLPIQSRTIGTSSGLRASADLQLVGDRARPGGRRTTPGSDEDRHHVPEALIGERRSRLEREALARHPRVVARKQGLHDRDRLAHGGERARLVDAEAIEPGALGKSQVRATARHRIEQRSLARDLVRMEREGVERGRPEAHALADARHQEQRPDRGLVEEVVEDGDDVDPGHVRPPCDRLVRLRLLVGQKADPELSRYVSSSVTSVRSASRSIRMTTRSSGSGQHTRFSCSSQSS